MRNNMPPLVLSVLVIFVSWLLVSYLGNNSPEVLVKKTYLIIPFLWSSLFIYLHGKNHHIIAANAYIIFLLMLFADILNFGVTFGSTQVSYLLLSFLAVFIFILLYQELFTRKPRVASVFSLCIAIVFYAVPMFYIIYAINFNTVITRDVFFAISQTNIYEYSEFLFDYISPAWIGVALFFVLVTGSALLRYEKKETFRIEKSLLIFMVILLTVLSYNSKDDNRLYSFARNSVKEYIEELDLFRETQKKLRTGDIQFRAVKVEEGETYIILIGESLNKEHMGLYGYTRDTTAMLESKLDASNSMVFGNAFSSHTHTMEVLSLALTEANQTNRKDYYESLSVLDVLKKSNFETYWLTNQILYGTWDNLVSIIAHNAGKLIALNRSVGEYTRTQKYDGDLVDEVGEILAESSSRNRVIFVHLMGNHGDYCSRYPEEYEVFQQPLKKGKYGAQIARKGLSERVNCYDNSVIYNTYVVSTILEMLQQREGSNALVYFSDHADDVFGGLGHGSGNFTYEMTQIPLITWFSNQYIERYPDNFHSLKENVNQLFPNDLLYDTLLGIFNIKTDRYESIHDLSSGEYRLAGDQAYTLHRSRLYTDEENYIWWQKINTQFLSDSSQSSRVFPHRVNSTGKLRDVWNDGFRSFEVDVRFGDDGAGVFHVGHNHGVMGLTLEEFLSYVSHIELERIWLDFKNLNKSNYQQAIKRLEYLDKKFGIKGKAVIESGTTLPFFQAFRGADWHISYYAPVSEIHKLLQENNTGELKRLANRIAAQSGKQKLSAISFNDGSYPFIKDYLEPLIAEDIVYHAWYGPAIYSKTFKSKLAENELYLDKRIKTILVKYKSPYDL